MAWDQETPHALELRMNSIPAPLLSLAHVTVVRGDREALRDINLEIACGEHVCILGPNGCGKSTLIKTITRECYPLAREGSRVSILGRERWDIFELRTLLGIVSPDLLASCTTDATGCDVVLSGFFSSTRIFPHHHPDREHLARVEETLARLGIAHLADRAVAEMSSGEAKRTLIARALVHNPWTLLLDEPSNAVDLGILRFDDVILIGSVRTASMAQSKRARRQMERRAGENVAGP